MRLTDRGIIGVDGKINQPLIGKGIAFYEMALIHYHKVLQQSGPKPVSEPSMANPAVNVSR